MQNTKRMAVTHQPDRMDRYLKVNRLGSPLIVASIVLLAMALGIAIFYGAISTDGVTDSLGNARLDSLFDGFSQLLKALV